MRRIYLIILLLALVFLSVVTLAAGDNEVILLNAGDCKILRINHFNRVAFSNPEVIEVVVTSSQEVIVNAKKPGLAAVNIWTPQGIITYRFSVREDFSSIEQDLQRLINNPAVQVSVNGRSVVLNGTVESSLDAEDALQYAKMYRENVINNLIVKNKSQILLSVIVTEVKTNAENKYGIRWGSWVKQLDGSMIFNDWQWTTIESGAPGGPSGQGIGRYPGNWWIGSMLDEMKQNGDAKILANPSILTMNGKEANFMAGGEIPIPLMDSSGRIVINWKEYGIKLKVTATMSRDNTVSMNISPEVSDLDWSNGVSLGNTGKIPAITSRKATTNVQFQSGSTLVIGGLLKRNDAQTVYKIPILGDLPIIGPLFRSSDFQNGKTELLFFVTPMIVKQNEPIEPNSITNPANQGPYFNKSDDAVKNPAKK